MTQVNLEDALLILKSTHKLSLGYFPLPFCLKLCFIV